MKIREFIDKYEIELSQESEQLCKDGFLQMTRSRDPLHSDMHVLDIVDLLDRFLQESKETLEAKINFNILLPAICWHDVWKSHRPQTTNLFKFKFEQAWDGIGSSKLFKKYIYENDFVISIEKEINHAIFHHAGMFCKWKNKKKYIEARILDDLDALDFWSEKRLDHLIKNYLDENEQLINPKILAVANWVIYKLSGKIDNYYFKWSDNEYQKRKEYILERGHEIMKKNKLDFRL